MSDSSPIRSDARDYTPAAPQLWTYDILCLLLTRASHWRRLLAAQINPQPGELIADVGCGTGTQLALLARSCPSLGLIGIDPDPPVIERARRKLARTGVPVEFMRGYARDAERLLKGRPVARIVSSLVFHQVPLEEKRAGCGSVFGSCRRATASRTRSRMPRACCPS